MIGELKNDLRIINKHKRILQEKYNVVQIGIFGSVAKGLANPKSDLDILVEFSKPIGMFKFIELEEQLSALLSKKVDLVTKQSLKPLIKAEILSHTIYA